MSFYGNVTNPQSFFKSIQVSRDSAVISVMETGDNLKIIGDGQFIDTVKVNSNTIGISQLTPNGLYIQCKDDPSKYFKIMIDSKGVLEIYEVTKED